MYPLTEKHEILRLSYEVDNLDMVHPMSDAKSAFYGFDDSKGRLAMVICHANDVGDYWEFIDEPRYRVKPSAEALKLASTLRCIRSHTSLRYFSGLDFGWIQFVPIPEVVHQVSEWKCERVLSVLSHVYKFMKNKFGEALVKGPRDPAAFDQIDSIPQR